MGGRGGSFKSGGGGMKAVHITGAQNVDSILSGGFDLSKAGSGAGSQWGNGVYFSTEATEQAFYKNRMSSQTGIEADIDTSRMLTADLGSGAVKNVSSMYDSVAAKLPDALQSEYKKAVRNGDKNKGISDRKKDALTGVVSKNYTGLIIKQNNPNGIDILTGGNQIVVYDTKAIKTRRKIK